MGELAGDSKGLNHRAAAVVERALVNCPFGVEVALRTPQVTILDCGARAPGGLDAGRLLAETCLAGHGSIETSLHLCKGQPLTKVTVSLDRPYVPCLLSQYAGWQIAKGKFFAMGSGPMRALAKKEEIFKELGLEESADIAVGVLETSALPKDEVIDYIRESCGHPQQLYLLAARTASVAGSFQVVARSVETCLHKLHELGFDVRRVRSAIGSAYLPPIPGDDLTAIGRTNDSILYGGEVLLWVDGDDESIAATGPKVPASASPDYGEPFRNIFDRYGGDFYKIDPLLFSPGRVAFNNVATGTWQVFGQTDDDILAASFFGAQT